MLEVGACTVQKKPCYLFNLGVLIRYLTSVALLFDASTMGFCLVCSTRRSFDLSDAHSPDVHSSNFHSSNVFQPVNSSLDLV